MDEPGIRPGALVRSLAGRDQGTCYIVLRLAGNGRVLVGNGRRRTIDRPKTKNRRHLEVVGWVEPTLALRLDRGDRVSDSEIERVLEALPPQVLEEV